MNAGYRWIMHKWSFVIEGSDSEIYHDQEIEFLNTKMKVTFTLRRPETMTMGNSENETFIEAWIIESDE